MGKVPGFGKLYPLQLEEEIWGNFHPHGNFHQLSDVRDSPKLPEEAQDSSVMYVTHPNFLRKYQALSTLPPVQPSCPFLSQLSMCWGDSSSLMAPSDSIDSLSEATAEDSRTVVAIKSRLQCMHISQSVSRHLSCC